MHGGIFYIGTVFITHISNYKVVKPNSNRKIMDTWITWTLKNLCLNAKYEQFITTFSVYDFY